MKREKTAMRRLADLLKKHEFVMDRCPEIIEIIEELYIDVEKQQIVKAFEDGHTAIINSEQYYKEIYGN
jgi:hypothetical protein